MTTTKMTARQRDKLIEAAQSAIEFSVLGTGEFPTDMLRYDHCWPASQGDAASIDTWRERVTAEGKPYAPRVINLRGLTGPTPRRWASFSWTVVKVNGEVVV